MSSALDASRTVMLCPVDDCEWQLDADPQPALDDLARLGPYEYLRRQLAEQEEQVRGHVETHTPLEWLTSIARRDRQLAVARSLLAPDEWERIEQA